MENRRLAHGFVLLGALSAACSVGLAAVAAHLPGKAQSLHATLQTALQMHQFHALALILTGLLLWQLGASRSFFRALVPAGGAAFILGWFTLAMGVIWRGVAQSTSPNR